jgi:hypothetical protein
MSLDTTQGENWTVVAYTVEPDRWMEVTAQLFNRLTSLGEASLPHYTVRAWHPQIFTITSLRVLRSPWDEPRVVTEIDEFMEGVRVSSYKVDPPDDDVDFRGCHAWIRRGETDSRWTPGRCRVLNQMSALAVEAYEEGVFDPDSRFEWAHMAVNVLAVNEAVNLGQAYYYDVLTGRSMGPYKTVSL